MFRTPLIGNKCAALKKQSMTSAIFVVSTAMLLFRDVLREHSIETTVLTASGAGTLTQAWG